MDAHFYGVVRVGYKFLDNYAHKGLVELRECYAKDYPVVFVQAKEDNRLLPKSKGYYSTLNSTWPAVIDTE